MSTNAKVSKLPKTKALLDVMKFQTKFRPEAPIGHYTQGIDEALDEIDSAVLAANAHEALVEAVQRAMDVETSVTQGVEKVFREGYRELLDAALRLANGGGA